MNAVCDAGGLAIKDEMIIKASRSAFPDKLELVPYFVMIALPALILSSAVSWGVTLLLVFIFAGFAIYLFRSGILHFKKSNAKRSMVIKITPEGVDVFEMNSGQLSQLTTPWKNLVRFHVDKTARGSFLRLSLKRPENMWGIQRYRQIKYHETALSVPCKDIMTYVYDVCPYGKDISFWNERRD